MVDLLSVVLVNLIVGFFAGYYAHHVNSKRKAAKVWGYNSWAKKARR